MENMKVKVQGGYLVATEVTVAGYPGIDVEFVPDDENNNVSEPRVLFEKPDNEELKVYVWSDRNNEDYTHKIIFDK